jgi:hypothetical protein
MANGLRLLRQVDIRDVAFFIGEFRGGRTWTLSNFFVREYKSWALARFLSFALRGLAWCAQ